MCRLRTAAGLATNSTVRFGLSIVDIPAACVGIAFIYRGTKAIYPPGDAARFDLENARSNEHRRLFRTQVTEMIVDDRAQLTFEQTLPNRSQFDSRSLAGYRRLSAVIAWLLRRLLPMRCRRWRSLRSAGLDEPDSADGHLRRQRDRRVKLRAGPRRAAAARLPARRGRPSCAMKRARVPNEPPISSVQSHAADRIPVSWRSHRAAAKWYWESARSPGSGMQTRF